MLNAAGAGTRIATRTKCSGSRVTRHPLPATRSLYTFAVHDRYSRAARPTTHALAWAVQLSSHWKPWMSTAYINTSAPHSASRPFVLADIGEGITECEIVKWLVEAGQTIEEFDPVVEVMSDKATVEITSPFSGKITKLTGGAVGDIVKVGSVLMEVESIGDEEATSSTESVSVPVETHANLPRGSSSSHIESKANTSPVSSMTMSTSDDNSTSPINKLVHATPATRRMARESSIRLSDVPGTGRDGRVTKSDVMAYVDRRPGAEMEPSMSAKSSQATTGIYPPTTEMSSTSAKASSSAPSTSAIPLSPVRKAMYRAMTSTLQIPHFSYSETIDVTMLERLRIKLNARIPLNLRKTLSEKERALLTSNRELWGTDEPSTVEIKHEEKYDRMTLLPLMIKAMSRAMEQHPLFSCTLSTVDQQQQLNRRRSHDISIALSASGGGLYTPVLASVDKSSPFTLASRISYLQHISQSNLNGGGPKFSKEYLGSGTMTLSNVGVVGGTTTHPLIPPTGQLAIGALGKTRVVPMYANEQTRKQAKDIAIQGEGDTTHLKIEPRLMMDVTFSADHRVVEGVELARLVESWKQIIEQPDLLVGAGQ